MSDWTFSQWIILPLWFLANITVALGLLGLLAYPVIGFLRGLRMPNARDEMRANTPALPRTVRDTAAARR